MIKFKDILDEVKLVQRRSKEERQKKHAVQLNNVIKHYSKQSSEYFEEHPEKIDLDLSNLNFEPKLPDNLTVYGDLDLTNTPIKELPSDLKVGANLYLYKSPIKELPSGLEVDGSLDLTNAPIISLPSDLKVGGHLDLTNTPISKEYTQEQLKKMLPNVKGNIYK
jgi:hypothetical protein